MTGRAESGFVRRRWAGLSATCGAPRTSWSRWQKRRPRRKLRRPAERDSDGPADNTERGSMGQKVHPYSFRLGYTKTWKSRWFAKRDYSDLLHEDLRLKKELKEQLRSAGISSIEVDRMANMLRIVIHTARPGIIIGRKGSEIDRLKGELQKKTGREVYLDIQEVYRPQSH